MAIRNNAPFFQPDAAKSVTPSDTGYIIDQKTPVVLYIGGAGDLRVLTGNGDDVTYTGVEAGWFPVQVVRVFSSDTGASNIIANWNA